MDVACTIRSVGERTTKLCQRLLASQICDQRVHLVGGKPFSETLSDSLAYGIKSQKKWLLCVDADVLPFQGAVSSLIRVGETCPDSVAEIQGVVFDRFFGGWRPAGVHLYRTLHLEKALEVLAGVTDEVRPETSMLNLMAEHGFHWRQISLTFGLHDYSQHPRDVYRKAFLHAWKHEALLPRLLAYWRLRADEDDFFWALKGAGAGIAHRGYVPLDREADCYAAEVDELPVLLLDDLPDCRLIIEREHVQIRALGYSGGPVWDWSEGYWGRAENSSMLNDLRIVLQKEKLSEVRLSNEALSLFRPLTLCDEFLAIGRVEVSELPLISLDAQERIKILLADEVLFSCDKGERESEVLSVDKKMAVFVSDIIKSQCHSVIVYGSGEVAQNFFLAANQLNLDTLVCVESCPVEGKRDPLGREILKPEEGLQLYPDADVVIASRAFVNPMLHRLQCFAAPLPKIWIVP